MAGILSGAIPPWLPYALAALAALLLLIVLRTALRYIPSLLGLGALLLFFWLISAPPSPPAPPLATPLSRPSAASGFVAATPVPEPTAPPLPVLLQHHVSNLGGVFRPSLVDQVDLPVPAHTLPQGAELNPDVLLIKSFTAVNLPAGAIVCASRADCLELLRHKVATATLHAGQPIVRTAVDDAIELPVLIQAVAAGQLIDGPAVPPPLHCGGPSPGAIPAGGAVATVMATPSIIVTKPLARDLLPTEPVALSAADLRGKVALAGLAAGAAIRLVEVDGAVAVPVLARSVPSGGAVSCNLLESRWVAVSRLPVQVILDATLVQDQIALAPLSAGQPVQAGQLSEYAVTAIPVPTRFIAAGETLDRASFRVEEMTVDRVTPGTLDDIELVPTVYNLATANLLPGRPVPMASLSHRAQ